MAEIYKITEDEYVHFSTTKPPRGTAYEIVIRANVQKVEEDYDE